MPVAEALDLWLVDNRVSPGHTTFAEASDSLLKVGINVAERGRQMTSTSDARELAALALAETVDALQVLNRRGTGPQP